MLTHTTDSLELEEELESQMKRREVMEEEIGETSQIVPTREDKLRKEFQRAPFQTSSPVELQKQLKKLPRLKRKRRLKKLLKKSSLELISTISWPRDKLVPKPSLEKLRDLRESMSSRMRRPRPKRQTLCRFKTLTRYRSRLGTNCLGSSEETMPRNPLEEAEEEEEVEEEAEVVFVMEERLPQAREVMPRRLSRG